VGTNPRTGNDLSLRSMRSGISGTFERLLGGIYFLDAMVDVLSIKKI